MEKRGMLGSFWVLQPKVRVVHHLPKTEERITDKRPNTDVDTSPGDLTPDNYLAMIR